MLPDQDLHPSLLKRKVIHVDMDAYYASVEIRDQPHLADKPVIVGGSPEGRGVVLTCNYIARKYGVRSAMPAATAIRKCRNAVFLRPRFDVYVAEAKKIRAIFRRYTQIVQPLSLDEAFLDVTSNPLNLPAMEIATRIRAEIKSELRLTASAGVAPNKMIAKIASDFNKPDGLTVVRPTQVSAFMRNLKLAKLPGVGPKTAERLAAKNFVTCADILDHDRSTLVDILGDFGLWLVKRSKGIDDRPVASRGLAKSIGRERTFHRDLTTLAQIEEELTEIAASIARRAADTNAKGRTVTLKVRYRGFETVTRAASLSAPTACAETIRETAKHLLNKTAAETRPVRLIGLSLRNLSHPSQQRSLFGD